MFLTGVFLSLTISCKMVGLFAFMAVGTAVVVDLWNLLDVRRGLKMVRFFFPFPFPSLAHPSHLKDHVAKHFFARVLGLIVIPAIVYLFWFWVHFAVLSRSGTGDEFMSPAFQQTLADSPLTALAEGALSFSHWRRGTVLIDFEPAEIRYYDTIILQHKTTKAFLHSHPDKYPLKYDDGRISSAGSSLRFLSSHFPLTILFSRS